MQLKIEAVTPDADRLTAKQARTLIARARGNKYRAKRIIVDGHRFDSKAEAKRWGQLVLMQQAGVISGLSRQTKLPCIVNGQLICTYVADFTYADIDGHRVVEDVKNPATAAHPAYRIKVKLVRALHGLEIREIHANRRS